MRRQNRPTAAADNHQGRAAAWPESRLPVLAARQTAVAAVAAVAEVAGQTAAAAGAAVADAAQAARQSRCCPAAAIGRLQAHLAADHRSRAGAAACEAALQGSRQPSDRWCRQAGQEGLAAHLTADRADRGLAAVAAKAAAAGAVVAAGDRLGCLAGPALQAAASAAAPRLALQAGPCAARGGCTWRPPGAYASIAVPCMLCKSRCQTMMVRLFRTAVQNIYVSSVHDLPDLDGMRLR